MTDILFKCPECGEQLAVGLEDIGFDGTCPECEKPIQIPNASFEVQCLDCKELFKIAENLRNQTIICPRCERQILVSDGSTETKKNLTLKREVTPQSDSNIPLSSIEKKCPQCGEALTGGAILCVKCGFNLPTSKKLEISQSSETHSYSPWAIAVVVLILLLVVAGGSFFFYKHRSGELKRAEEAKLAAERSRQTSPTIASTSDVSPSVISPQETLEATPTSTAPQLATAPTPPAVRGLRIIKAEYGARTSWVDVTAKLQSLIRNNSLTVQSGTQLAGRDPISGNSKELRITYLSAGKQKTVSVREGSSITIRSETPLLTEGKSSESGVLQSPKVSEVPPSNAVAEIPTTASLPARIPPTAQEIEEAKKDITVFLETQGLRGAKYEAVRITKITPSDVEIIHKGGVATIAIEKLPSDLQAKLGFDPSAAAELRAAEQQQLKEAANRREEQQRASEQMASASTINGAVTQVDRDGLFLDGNKFVVGHPRQHQVVEGDRLQFRAWRDGVYSYVTVGQYQRTIEKWRYCCSAQTERASPKKENQKIQCGVCRGSGQIVYFKGSQGTRCSSCGGSGYVRP